jgi:hypothetical protein
LMAFGFRDPVELLKLCLDESVALKRVKDL